MTSIEVAIAASMELGKLVLPESIEAVYKYGDDVAIVTPDAIITIPREIFHNYIIDWLEAVIEI